MARRAKSCYSCPAYMDTYCSLGYELEYVNWGLHRPKVCCNKPKTIKEYFSKLRGKGKE